MALTIRERKLPQLDLRSCAFRYSNPPVQAQASTSGEYRMSDFDRLDVLGRGSCGTVYKVAHRRTSALYALKTLHGGDTAGAASEADVLRRANTPYVVRCHSVLPAASASGDIALLLELVDGGSLDSVMARSGAFPEAALAEVAAQALSGLLYLHARRVVHRDVKPANFLVSTAGDVKIADFGIAKVLSRTGDGCPEYEGTAAYMSPERFDSERRHGADPCAADVWGLGVTILELLMGRYPLLPAGQKLTRPALMCAICFGEMPTLPDSPASLELRGFVAACLQKDHTKRPSVAQLLAHPFVAGRDATASKHALRRLVARD
jgi:serine/threonine protein kinase